MIRELDLSDFNFDPFKNMFYIRNIGKKHCKFAGNDIIELNLHILALKMSSQDAILNVKLS